MERAMEKKEEGEEREEERKERRRTRMTLPSGKRKSSPLLPLLPPDWADSFSSLEGDNAM